jgi:hypothetical protein
MKKLIIILSILFASIAYADHEDEIGSYYFQQVPALCGSIDKINTYLDHFNFKPYNLSLGREGMREDGQPVYMITYYVNEDETQTTAVIDVPNKSESCILFHTFDLTKPNKG